MSVDKKQTEIQHTFTAQNKFLRLTEKTGSHPTVNLNDFGNDIRSVRVSEIGVLISLLMSVEKHLNKEEPELKPPFGEDEIVLEPGQLFPTASQVIAAGEKKRTLEDHLRGLGVVEDPEEEDDDTERYEGYGKDAILPDGVMEKHPFRGGDNARWLLGEEVCRAWDIPGRSPEYHEQMKFMLRDSWPALHSAVQNYALARPHDAR